MNSSPLLNVESLCLTIKDKFILKDISFHINAEETAGIVGESGSGKSMIAKSILRLGHPIKGRIILEGEDLLRKSEKEMQQIRGRKIAFICQNPMTALNPLLSIGYQLSESMIVHEKKSKKEALKHSADLLKKVGIHDPVQTLKQFPDQLSGGMLQRVIIAMALSCSPSLLIADEPTTNLDAITQAQILQLLKDIQKEFRTSILLISHDLDVITAYCQKILVLQSGRIIESGTANEVGKNSQHAYTKTLYWH